METKLSMKIKIGYGAGSFLESGLYNFMTTFLMIYLTSVVALSPALAGTISSVAILMEAIGGAVAGHVSDQFYSKWGRRRPIILASILAITITVIAVFVEVNGKIPFIFLYYFIMTTVFWAAFSAYYVPYIALGAEMTGNYDERTNLRTYCRFFAILGNMFCTVCPLAFISILTKRGVDDNKAWLIFAVIMALMTAISGLVTWSATRGVEPVYSNKDNRPKAEPIHHVLKEYLDFFKLKLCRTLLEMRAFFIIAYTLYTASLVFFMKYKLGFDDTVTSTTFMVGIIASFTYMPFISRLALKFGKQQMLMLAMLISGVSGVIISIVGVESLKAAVVYICFFTFAHSSCWQLFNSMFYDITEVDQFVNGARREGSLASLTSVMGTIAVAIGLWLQGVLLKLGGFDAALQIQQERTIVMIDHIFIPIPSILMIIAGAILISYPMNKERFNAVIEALHRRERGEDCSDLMSTINPLLK